MSDARDENGALLREMTVALHAGWQVLDPAAPPSDWETVRRALEARIGELLRSDPRRLTTAMYLLDVPEKQFALAMDQPTHDDRAHALSLVVMERETQKIRTRMRYGKSSQPT